VDEALEVVRPGGQAADHERRALRGDEIVEADAPDARSALEGKRFG
jgi:hypothetical protein